MNRCLHREASVIKMRRRLLKLILLALLSGIHMTSALAEPKREYCVIRDTLTKKCTVTDRVPITPSRAIVVDTRLSFENKTEAETGMKSMKPCMK
jgi:hypothetical protein